MKDSYALVIEDSVSMREFISVILQQETGIGHVIEAETPDQALELLQQPPGRLALIISDWNMPGMSLQDFMQKLQAQPQLADAPVFLLTASSEDKAHELATAIDARAVLTKPFSAADLIGIIDVHIHPKERRRAKRVIPLMRCMVDLGFDASHPHYNAEVLNISATGILTRAPTPAAGVGCIYDFASLTLLPDDDEPIKIYAQVVRKEADPEVMRNRGDTVLMAFNFGRMDEETLTLLRRYITLNDIDPADNRH